jgi:hypothetical protein
VLVSSLKSQNASFTFPPQKANQMLAAAARSALETLRDHIDFA